MLRYVFFDGEAKPRHIEVRLAEIVRMVWWKVLATLVLCAPLAWVPYLAGAQQRVAFALVAWLIGPLVTSIGFVIGAINAICWKKRRAILAAINSGDR